jgi:hypothetical protein
MTKYVVYGPQNGHYGTYDELQRAKDVASRQGVETGEEYGVRRVEEE